MSLRLRLKRFSLILSFFLLNGLVFGEEKASVQASFNLVSSYIWRGHDLLRNYALLEKKSFSPHSGSWAFQPSITWNTPVEGLYANIFSSFALVGRDDKDIDQRIQVAPGDVFIANRASILDYALTPGLDLQSDIIASLPTTNMVSDFASAPAFYKENVGLKRNDELDITIGYEKETKVGKIGFGVIHYKYANPQNIDTDYGTEVFLKFSLPQIKSLTFAIYEDLEVETTYYSVGYSGTYEFTKDLSSSYSISAGYYVMPQVQGISDITLNYTVSHSSGFSFGFNVALTPDRKIQEYYWGSGDAVTAEMLNTKLPVEINGQSSIYDGKVADPSKTLGPVNDYINALVSSEISTAIGFPYTYTPRQELPKYYWWISLGYSVTFE